MYVFTGWYCLLLEAATRVEVFCKKGVLKNFVNYIGKHLCWILFSIKFQALHLFWRTSANDYFCTTLAPLTVTYPFYFIFSTFFLIVTATTVNISDVCFSFKLKRCQRIWFLIFTEVTFIGVNFFFYVFFVFLSFVLFFLSLFIKTIILSWELIKIFLPTFTSLKYVHVSN